MTIKMILVSLLLLISILCCFVSYERKIFQKKYKFYFRLPTKHEVFGMLILCIIYVYLSIFRFTIR